MTCIRKLSSEVIGQIAAGEVVERPAAAIKELVENSIDAGAKNITVEIREGGIRYIRVSDNGKGIPADQIRMAFERHATSKISTAEELYHVDTLGFRGEALASVAAVARVTCTTKTAVEEYGVCAVIEAGNFEEIKEAASPVGTSIVVEKLFQNAPVRLKFLKKPTYEAAAVADYMMRLILSHPEIAFRFMNDGKTVYRSSGDGKLSNAVYCVYGSDDLKAMTPVHGMMNGLILDGYVGVDELSKGNRNHQSFFINDRYFQSIDISHAVEEACKGRVMIGRFPMCVLKLQLPNSTVDVNVHPNKLEVRFENLTALCQAVQTIIEDAFSGQTLKKVMNEQFEKQSIKTEETLPFNAEVEKTPKAVLTQREETAETEKVIAQQLKDEKTESYPLFEEKPLKTPLKNDNQKEKVIDYRTAVQKQKPVAALAEPAVRYRVVPEKPMIPLVHEKTDTPTQSVSVDFSKQENQQVFSSVLHQSLEEKPIYAGSLFDTYLIFQKGETVLLVDQHAAHEKLLFDRYMKQYGSETATQMLLCPKLVRLSAPEMTRAEEWIPALADAGFVIEPFDEHCVSVYGIPVFLDMADTPEHLLHEALEEWQAGKRDLNGDSLRVRIAQMACKHAIKGGDKLNREELDALIREILSSNSAPYCPHGRPIVIEISRRDLEKRFKRIQ